MGFQSPLSLQGTIFILNYVVFIFCRKFAVVKVGLERKSVMILLSSFFGLRNLSLILLCLVFLVAFDRLLMNIPEELIRYFKLSSATVL